MVAVRCTVAVSGNAPVTAHRSSRDPAGLRLPGRIGEMKRFLLAGALASSILSAAAAPALAQPVNAVAPADRYFGRLEMSILGVRNSLHDLSLQVDAHPEDAARVYDKALFVEDALHDWAKKFPSDPWIPKYAYSLAELYRKIDTEDARVHKNDTLDWLIASYPTSDYAKMGRI
jgi:hypothetical protein